MDEFDLIFFTGSRWVVTYSAQLLDLDLLNTARNTSSSSRKRLAEYFQSGFHAYWSNYSVSFVGVPVDVASPFDVNSPIGVRFSRAVAQKKVNQTALYRPGTILSEAQLLCASCENNDNPCLFEGVCINSTCRCPELSIGVLCEVPPLSNGYCNKEFNTADYDFDVSG